MAHYTERQHTYMNDSNTKKPLGQRPFGHNLARSEDEAALINELVHGGQPPADPHVALYGGMMADLLAEENIPPEETEHDKQLRLAKARAELAKEHGL